MKFVQNLLLKVLLPCRIIDPARESVSTTRSCVGWRVLRDFPLGYRDQLSPEAETAFRRRLRRGQAVGETPPGFGPGRSNRMPGGKPRHVREAGLLRDCRVHFGGVDGFRVAAVHQSGFGRSGVGAARIGGSDRPRSGFADPGFRPQGSFGGTDITGFSPMRDPRRAGFRQGASLKRVKPPRSRAVLLLGALRGGVARRAALSNARSLAGSRRRQEHRFGGALRRCLRTRAYLTPLSLAKS